MAIAAVRANVAGAPMPFPFPPRPRLRRRWRQELGGIGAGAAEVGGRSADPHGLCCAAVAARMRRRRVACPIAGRAPPYQREQLATRRTEAVGRLSKHEAEVRAAAYRVCKRLIPLEAQLHADQHALVAGRAARAADGVGAVAVIIHRAERQLGGAQRLYAKARSPARARLPNVEPQAATASTTTSLFVVRGTHIVSAAGGCRRRGARLE